MSLVWGKLNLNFQQHGTWEYLTGIWSFESNSNEKLVLEMEICKLSTQRGELKLWSWLSVFMGSMDVSAL
jgi:hypothetical protein